MPKTETPDYDVESESCSEMVTIPESIIRVETYWFSDKNNHPILKRIVDEINIDGINKCRVFMDDDNHVFLEVSENQDMIRVLFPNGFPQKSPEIEYLQSKREKHLEWNYNGDIYDSFIRYYKQLIK